MSPTVNNPPPPSHLARTGGAICDRALTIPNLIKALAHLGCSCVVKTREVELEAHQVFCRYRMKLEDLSK